MSQNFEKIPLLSLSDAAISTTMRFMDHCTLLALSLQSQKSKNLVRSLNLKAESVVYVAEFIAFNLSYSRQTFLSLRLTYSTPWYPIFINIEDPPQTIEISHLPDANYPNEVECKWSNKMGPQKWSNHLKFVFNYSNPLRIVFGGSVELDLQSIRDAFPEIDEIQNMGNSKNVLQTFLSSVKNININRDVFVDQAQVDQKPKTFQHVSIQNLDRLCLYIVGKINLDDLISMNCRYFATTDHVKIQLKDVNRFLKGWIRGGNPRLEYMTFWFREPNPSRANIGQVFKGITHQILPEDHEQTVKEHMDDNSILKMEKKIKGGYSIRNKYGTLATVKETSGEGFVWRLVIVVWK